MEDRGEEQIMANGLASSSRIPGFHLIPSSTLVKLANRFEFGIKRKGERAWNAVSKNQEVLGDREFTLERIGHIIKHTLVYRDELVSNRFGIEDHAGAILWGGSFLSSVDDWKDSRNPPQAIDINEVQSGGKFKVWDIVYATGLGDKPYVITTVNYKDGDYTYILRNGGIERLISEDRLYYGGDIMR